MEFSHDYKPDYEHLKTLLLEMAQEHNVATLLEKIVRQLASRPHVALARVWLIQEGDCPCSAKEPTCDDKQKCLHLVASQGRSLADSHADWSRLDGNFSRFAVGARKVGWIAATGKAVEVNDIEKDSKWIADPEWAQREGISFSVVDKLHIAQKLDELGIQFIEGGWPGSNPKDMEFFDKARGLTLTNSVLVAFGSTRHPKTKAETDVNLLALTNAGVKVVTLVGKGSELQVTQVLETTLDENLSMVADSIHYLKAKGFTVYEFTGTYNLSSQ